MTREEILNMKPGGELDLLVMEHVFKMVAWEERRGDYLHVTFQSSGDREPYMRTRDWQSRKERYRVIPFSEINLMKHIVYGVKDCSSDISAAWEVWNKMFQEGFIFKLSQFSDGTYQIEVFSIQKGFLFPSDYFATAPEAIVKAALLAVIE